MTSSLFESYLSLFLPCAQHRHIVCYCRADAVKDERSEVNHFASNVCAPYAEDSKGKALSGASEGGAVANPAYFFSFSIFVRKTSSISPLYVKYLAP